MHEFERNDRAGLTIVPFRIEKLAFPMPLGRLTGLRQRLGAITPPLEAHIR
jgi:hypothetical protein